MADRIVLHIGAMKTGTSYLQSLLVANAAAHADHGFLYVGRSFRTQMSAATQVLKWPNRPDRHVGWRALVDEARRFEGGTAVVSMEFLSFAREHQVDAYLAPLAGFEIDVVLTVRDQFTAIPAQWGSYARRLGDDSWRTYLRRIDPARRRKGDRGTRAARTYTRAQSLDLMVQRWGGHPSVRRLDVVTAPAAGSARDELWQRFARAVAMPADLATSAGSGYANPSQGYASSEVLRRLNRHLQDQPVKACTAALRPMILDALVPFREREGKPQLDRGGAALAREVNRRVRAAVLDGGHTVHGSLEALPVPDDLPRAPRKAAKPDPDLVRQAASALWERCASEPGVGSGTEPRTLDAVVADLARMLPLTPRWRAVTEKAAAR